jgi:hypothetical protein
MTTDPQKGVLRPPRTRIEGFSVVEEDGLISPVPLVPLNDADERRHVSYSVRVGTSARGAAMSLLDHKPPPTVSDTPLPGRTLSASTAMDSGDLGGGFEISQRHHRSGTPLNLTALWGVREGARIMSSCSSSAVPGPRRERREQIHSQIMPFHT